MTTTIPVSALALTNYAKKWKGTKESPAGSNKTKFGEDFGENGVAWCAIFVYYCFAHVKGGVRLEDPKVLGGTKRSYMSTDYMRARMKAAGWTRITNASELKRGDIAFWQFGVTGEDVNHVSMILTSTSTTITSIDGNSGNSSENDGGEVSTRTRAASYMLDAYRPPYRKTGTSLKVATIAAVLTGLGITGTASITGQTATEITTSASATKTTTTTTASASKTSTITCTFGRELKKGDHGQAVYRLRAALGEGKGKLFTASTKAALVKAQKKAGITADGELGATTVKKVPLVYKGARCTWVGK